MMGIGRVSTYCAAHRRFEWQRINIRAACSAHDPSSAHSDALTTFARAGNLVG
jgi:hypothetical protein